MDENNKIEELVTFRDYACRWLTTSYCFHQQ